MKRKLTVRMFWEILSPIIMYLMVTTLTLIALDILMLAMPVYIDSALLRQCISSVVVFFFLWATYTQSKENKKGMDKKAALFAVLLGGSFAIVWNTILGMSGIAEVSDGYNQVAENFYTGKLVLEIIALCIVIPIVEEILYRGIVYVRLRSWLGVRWAIFISAVIFGLVHMNLVQFVYATVFGFVLAYMTEKTGNFYAAAAAHMMANLTSVLRAETSLMDWMDKGIAGKFGSMGLFLICSIFCIYWFYKKDEINV